jgi:hypothetical protein
MKTHSNEQMGTGEGSRLDSAEQRLKELGINLLTPPEPFGSYVEAVQTGTTRKRTAIACCPHRYLDRIVAVFASQEH